MSGTSSGFKMKAFSLAPKKPLNKKEQEKQKKLLEDQEAAQAYQEFVETFGEAAPKSKTFVKSSTLNPGSGEEDASKQFYKTTKLAQMEEQARKEFEKKKEAEKSNSSNAINSAAKKKEKDKKRSNLELFKEELKIMQEEREERHKLKTILKKEGNIIPETPTIKLADDYRLPTVGSFDTGDPNTTNIYLGNINPKMTEQQLMESFGKYGPLASVKIMWPRSDEERARNRNCGFVAFMTRKDAERALRNLSGKDVMAYEMKLGWGKAVPIPPHPVYIPPKLLELTQPPPMSGLPFNAQPAREDKGKVSPAKPWHVLLQEDKKAFEKILERSTVRVVIPTDRNVLSLIHRMVEFVVREGPMFEAMIMNREINNPMFRFLFDNMSPAHVYYRWRLFSILQAEQPSKWRTEEFRMFVGGSMWKPAPVNPFSKGMPAELIEDDLSEESSNHQSPRRGGNKNATSRERVFKEVKKKGVLTESKRQELEEVLRNLVPEKQKIGDAMVYCLEQAEAAEEVISCITESLTIAETPLHKKIARLHLVSDILHNCTARVANASFYRQGFESRLVEIFYSLHDVYESIEGRLKAEQFKQKIVYVFRVWEDWALYSSDFLVRLQNIFLGLIPKEREIKSAVDEDIDGVPLLDDAEDIDGVPFDDVDGQPISDGENDVPKFKRSKWETVDEDF